MMRGRRGGEAKRKRKGSGKWSIRRVGFVKLFEQGFSVAFGSLRNHGFELLMSVFSLDVPYTHLVFVKCA